MTEHLVVDLRGKQIETLDDFWDAVAGPCGLPSWFGRNIDTWRDTIQTRGVSDVIESPRAVVTNPQWSPPPDGRSAVSRLSS